MKSFCFLVPFAILGFASAAADPVQPAISRADRGMPAVTVAHTGGSWTIAGQHTTVILDARSLALHVQAGPAIWDMVPSAATDMRVKAGDEEFFVRLADAGKISIVPYDTGFKTGVKIALGQWPQPFSWKHLFQKKLDLTL